MTPAAHRALIVGCARNAAAALPAVLHNIAQIAACFAEVACIFIENDSDDDTLARLRTWCRGHPRCTVYGLTGLSKLHPQRTLRLEICRNLYIHQLRTDPLLRSYETLVVLDMDDINARMALDPSALQAALAYLNARPERGAVFAWQPQYYDLWALRHPQHFPIDIWEAIRTAVLELQLSDQDAARYVLTQYPLQFISASVPTAVDSAFGGLGFYKVPPVLANVQPYCGSRFHYQIVEPGRIQLTRLQQCEHVSFNYGLRAQGLELHILPWLVNNTDPHRINPAAWRTLSF